MAKHREPNVSVVIPSYNHARFVEKCLRSVIDQKLAPAELIVIDDGSIDDSPAIVERVLKECPVPCELIVRKHKGLCATLNEGLDNTRGKYFAYLGSDDVWLPAFLKERVRLLESRPDSVLGFGHCLIIDDTDRVIDCTDRWAHYVDGQARENPKRCQMEMRRRFLKIGPEENSVIACCSECRRGTFGNFDCSNVDPPHHASLGHAHTPILS